MVFWLLTEAKVDKTEHKIGKSKIYESQTLKQKFKVQDFEHLLKIIEARRNRSSRALIFLYVKFNHVLIQNKTTMAANISSQVSAQKKNKKNKT